MAQGHDTLVRKLLEDSIEVAPALLRIDGYKEALRAEIQETGAGFTTEIEGLGTVEGKLGCEAKTKGHAFVLDQDAFEELSEARRQKLIDGGVVRREPIVQPARKPSVTVRL